jgi:RNA polymerase sigma-70 factor (ECF subfamily)
MVDPIITSRFNEIYDSTYKAVLSFITAKCGSTSDISDIAQETFMELYQLLIKRGAGYIINEKAIVLKIAKQKLAKHYSLMERLRLFVPMFSKNEDGDEIPLSDLEAEAFVNDDYLFNQSLVENARQIIKRKSEDVKKIFYLFYDLDLTISEIANELSISESNVKHKLYRTLKEIQSLLQ